jgi:hypothetical protein
MKHIITESQFKILNESIVVEEQAKKRIIEMVNSLKNSIPKQTNKIINVNGLFDELQNYLIQRIPLIVEKAKSGKGGDWYAYDCYKKVLSLFNESLSNISGLKKSAIKSYLPKKEKFVEDSKTTKKIDVYFQLFDILLWFPDSAIYRQKDMDIYYDNFQKFCWQASDWLEKNQKNIINSFVNSMVQKFYN